jgi:hypothetical protein
MYKQVRRACAVRLLSEVTTKELKLKRNKSFNWPSDEQSKVNYEIPPKDYFRISTNSKYPNSTLGASFPYFFIVRKLLRRNSV